MIGQRVLRSFPRVGSVLGRVHAVLPLGAADNDSVLFKVVHADGDSEELDADELKEAIEAYASGGSKGRALQQPPYANEQSAGGVQNRGITVGALGLPGLRAELISVESELGPNLRLADASWAAVTIGGAPSGGKGGSKGGAAKSAEAKSADATVEDSKGGGGKGGGGMGLRARWLKAVKDAKSPQELAPLLLQLEAIVYSLQLAPDLQEQRLYRTEDDKIGMPARRFLPTATEGDSVSFRAYDGKITGWLPAEGEDCALWHFEMEDGDDEELDLQETFPATLAARTADNAEPGAIGETPAAQHAAVRVGSASENRRLWSTGDARDRWHKAVHNARNSASLSVAIHALRVHNAAFSRMLAPGATRDKNIAELRFEVDSYYHPQAFEYVRKSKRKRARTK
ncbi:hypothetical protein Ctob_007717 [Chrysochromulina tobinii]|uniref:Uncharacterized protein n=1 Tax=Chrysochromulina tobinii TaxID=1460289 RepID=A0A0M0LPF2_9EUKA|nr:hypothetical protein Ctob_007717 [Chrysochromulina tobinii]|eukprot:KOO52886.1 hypothetical protein Ctob_007717 [Chrysochromulina sp. CCMP291]